MNEESLFAAVELSGPADEELHSLRAKPSPQYQRRPDSPPAAIG